MSKLFFGAVMLVTLGAVAMCSSSSDVVYKDGKLTLKCEDCPLEEVLERIHGATGVELVLDGSFESTKLTANIESLPIGEAIERLFEGSEINYAMVFDPPDSENLTKLFVTHGPTRTAPTVGAQTPSPLEKSPALPEGVTSPPVEPTPQLPPVGNSVTMPPVEETPGESPAVGLDTGPSPALDEAPEEMPITPDRAKSPMPYAETPNPTDPFPALKVPDGTSPSMRDEPGVGEPLSSQPPVDSPSADPGQQPSEPELDPGEKPEEKPKKKKAKKKNSVPLIDA